MRVPPSRRDSLEGPSYTLDQIQRIAVEDSADVPNEIAGRIHAVCERMWNARRWRNDRPARFRLMEPLEDPETNASLIECTHAGCRDVGVAALIVIDSNAVSWWCMEHAAELKRDDMLGVFDGELTPASSYPPCCWQDCGEHGVAPLVFRANPTLSTWWCIDHAPIAIGGGLWRSVNES